MGYFGSSVSPRSDRKSSFDLLGSTAALLCLVFEFSSCTFTETNDFNLVEIEASWMIGFKLFDFTFLCRIYCIVPPICLAYNFALPDQPADGDTYLHGRMVLHQPHKLKPGFLTQFLHSKFCVSWSQSDCNCVQWKLLMIWFSEEAIQAIKTTDNEANTDA